MFKLIILCLNTRCNLKNWWLLLLLHTRNHRSSARSTPGSLILYRPKCTQTHHHIQLGILYSADPMYVGPIGLGRLKLISKMLNVSAANLGPADPLQSCITSMSSNLKAENVFTSAQQCARRQVRRRLSAPIQAS
ncbi:hypothetical protein KC19_1G106900 [Ceratodon purpureus]|uniref:Uncharacterized protein n=1 Tax=Ceratodon purpureus TaxID=3225 RepID=A0A8T0J6S7_CERPU|nr:hypothetical protein KC19_1G106900 [Ceratodon purpureus]